MVYCMHHFIPLLLLPAASPSLTVPFVICLVLFTIFVHRPCVQCTVLGTATMMFLCHSGRSQYCICSMTELGCTFNRPADASQSLCKALSDAP